MPWTFKLVRHLTSADLKAGERMYGRTILSEPKFLACVDNQLRYYS